MRLRTSSSSLELHISTVRRALLSTTSNMGISNTEFRNAVVASGYPAPSSSVFRAFENTTGGFSRGELAMFLAQVIHESGGFQYKEEIAYKNRPNHGAYVDNVGLLGRDYHGRGFIQLTWGANYKAASEGLGMGDKLLRNPHLVAEDDELAMLVSVWYWKARVRPKLAGHEDEFGVTTNAINGALECSGGWNQRAANRYQIYLKVAKALGIRNPARENGCYN